jgi:hypothetical protein
MTTDAARQVVFSTVELLEQILLYLSMKKVFVVQRVSRHFRDVIGTSVLLQHELFLRPSPVAEPGKTWRLISPKGRNRQVLGQEVWNDPKSHRLVRSNQDVATPPGFHSLLLAPTRLNSYLRITFTYFEDGTPVDTRKPVMASFDGERVFINCPPFPRDKGSWRQMYLSDPPIRQLFVAFFWFIKAQTDDLYSNGFRSIRNDSGLTLGIVVDEILDEAEERYQALREDSNKQYTMDLLDDIEDMGKSEEDIELDGFACSLEGLVCATEAELKDAE